MFLRKNQLFSESSVSLGHIFRGKSGKTGLDGKTGQETPGLMGKRDGTGTPNW
jgi:hypothetical protein